MHSSLKDFLTKTKYIKQIVKAKFKWVYKTNLTCIIYYFKFGYYKQSIYYLNLVSVTWPFPSYLRN